MNFNTDAPYTAGIYVCSLHKLLPERFTGTPPIKLLCAFIAQKNNRHSYWSTSLKLLVLATELSESGRGTKTIERVKRFQHCYYCNTTLCMQDKYHVPHNFQSVHRTLTNHKHKPTNSGISLTTRNCCFSLKNNAANG